MAPERTPDGRWIVVDGRRWRATDPSIPAAFHRALVEELMRARREVGVATRAGDAERLGRARADVGVAKVALGERGEPWWEVPSEAGRRARIRSAILALARHRSPDATICPSDAARAVGGEGWRASMPVARDEARQLALDGAVEIRQGGRAIDPSMPWKGPIRIWLPGPAVPPSGG